jgi:hypothetical protein
MEATGPISVTFRAILTDIWTFGAQEVPRGDVSTVEFEKHRLVNEYINNGPKTALMYVRLDGGEDDILRLV